MTVMRLALSDELSPRIGNRMHPSSWHSLAETVLGKDAGNLMCHIYEHRIDADRQRCRGIPSIYD